MRLIVLFFGSDPRFKHMLERWVESARTHTSMPLSVLTDPTTVIDPSLGIDVIRADPEPFAHVMRPGNNFDRKSAIICAALQAGLLHNCCLCDVDTRFQGDPAEPLRDYSDELFAIAPDSGRRKIVLMNREFTEHSSSVMLFGSSDAFLTSTMTNLYVVAWEQIGLRCGDRGVVDDIREQRAWSLVAAMCDAPILPAVLNWSPFHWAWPWPKAVIVHFHGAGKFSKMDKEVRHD